MKIETGRLDKNMLVVTRDETVLLGELVAALKQQHPEAGRHYWGARAWGVLIWQPVLLSILATEVLQRSLNPEHMGQHCQGAVVAGMTLTEGLMEGNQSDRWQSACRLRQTCERWLEQLGRQIKVNPVLAKRLLADRILSTLLHVRPLLGESHEAAIRERASEWLEGANLSGASGLMSFAIPEQGIEMALDRKGCCQHYRRDDGSVCKTCPRQSKHIRIKRLQEEWSQDAGAE
ncbi:MAG: siderophore ferric iron reductase [Oceanospirillales bacterium]|nr:siderophore ferric iron reductase [Oceanospirillales bacterium]